MPVSTSHSRTAAASPETTPLCQDELRKGHNDARKQRSTLQKLCVAVLRGIVLFIIWRLVVRFVLPNAKPADLQDSIPCGWSAGQIADLYVYVSEEPIQTRFDDTELVLFHPNLVFGEYDNSKNVDKLVKVNIPTSHKLDAPIFGHVYLMKQGKHPNPAKSPFNPLDSSYRRIQLTGKKNVKDDTTTFAGFDTQSMALSSKESQHFWYPELHIALVNSADPITSPFTLPLHQRKLLSTTLDGKQYLPTVYLYEGWRLADKQIDFTHELIASHDISLKVTFTFIGKSKFAALANLSESFKVNESMFGIAADETEKLKEMFFETNPYLLFITLAVSLLHTLFDFLAFKNGTILEHFWKRTTNLTGLSVRSVLVNAGMQLVIFLYLLDQNSSWMILGSAAIGLVIEAWKITRVLSVKIKRTQNGWVCLEICDRDSYSTATKEHDSVATKYMMIAAAPALLAYAIYSFVYVPRTSWYSWLISTLVGFVYAFGFIAMTPQLFINYKLKSVAHMPWRVFIYKALNTFIDDLFAFVIRMPTLHRLACFRDDLIFVVYLYQRWIYPVDMARVNEYGQVFDAENLETTETHVSVKEKPSLRKRKQRQ